MVPDKYCELLAAGLIRGQPSFYMLFAEGKEVAIFLKKPEDWAAGSSDTFEFYAEGLDTLNRYPVYWLVDGSRAGSPPGNLRCKKASRPPQASFSL